MIYFNFNFNNNTIYCKVYLSAENLNLIDFFDNINIIDCPRY